MESVLEAIQIDDPQKQVVYENESRIFKETNGEVLPFESAQSAAQAIWETRLSLPIPLPDLDFNAERHAYDPWRHQIKLAGGKAPMTKLIHELAHAKIGAIGIGPLVESHGPIFCRTFGQMWSEYARIDFDVFRDRAEQFGISVANRMPNLSGAPWAVVQDLKGDYALRPAQRAVEMGLNVRKTFTLHVRDHHPMV